MNKTYCVQCGKEIEYEGFYCPTMCKECESKQIYATAESDMSVDRRYKIRCIICNEGIQLSDSEFELLFCTGKVNRLVCDKCKQAVMQVRKGIKDYERGYCLD